MKTPYPVLAIAFFLFCLAVTYTVIGKAWSRSRWFYRSDEPRSYWLLVAFYYACAFGFIAVFLHDLPTQ